MSRASEWARRNAQVQTTRPKFECVTWDHDFGEEPSKDGNLRVVGVIHETGHLYMPGTTVGPADACAFARWILETFDPGPQKEIAG